MKQFTLMMMVVILAGCTTSKISQDQIDATRESAAAAFTKLDTEVTKFQKEKREAQLQAVRAMAELRVGNEEQAAKLIVPYFDMMGLDTNIAPSEADEAVGIFWGMQNYEFTTPPRDASPPVDTNVTHSVTGAVTAVTNTTATATSP